MESKVCPRSQGQPSGARRRAMIAMASASGSVDAAASDCEADGTEGAIVQLYPKTSASCTNAMDYSSNRMKPESAANANPTRRRGRGVLLLLALPYLGLCFPQL